MELMGGTVGASSKKGEGSTFWIELDHKEQSNMPDIAKATDNASLKVKAQELATKTILYIEDNPANLRLIEQLIKIQTDYTFLSAPDPHLGLELAVAHKPDLILLDINLPGINGFEVLKRIRANTTFESTPVIAISANAMPKDLEMSKEVDFDGYITKPVDLTQLLSTINKQLE